MQLTSSQRTLLIILAILWALYFCTQSEEPIHNLGALEESQPTASKVVPKAAVTMQLDHDSYGASDDSESWLESKFQTRNQSSDGKREVSYAQGGRQANAGDAWERNFDASNTLIASGLESSSDKFAPMDDGANSFAAFDGGAANCGSGEKCDPEDLFDADNYLPDAKEVHDDWFDTQYEPVSVKNRHLINVTRPIGVTSIGASKKGAGHDLRGTPSCPKFVVSPWNNTSIDHDDNLRTAWD